MEMMMMDETKFSFLSLTLLWHLFVLYCTVLYTCVTSVPTKKINKLVVCIACSATKRPKLTNEISIF